MLKFGAPLPKINSRAYFVLLVYKLLIKLPQRTGIILIVEKELKNGEKTNEKFETN
jgi:hypothetical protein